MRSFPVVLLLLLALGCDTQRSADSSTGGASGSASQSNGGSPASDAGTKDAATGTGRMAASNDAAMRVDAGAAPQGPDVEVLRRSCTFDPLPSDWTLEPGWECSSVRGMPGRLECVPGMHCTHSDQCTDQPFGRCIGFGRTSCDYGLETTLCSTDAECTALPDGVCSPSIVAGERCFPSGECEPVGPSCFYPELQDDCAQDGDCASLPNGRCVRAVTHSTCQYNNQCAVDADCADTERCACIGSGDLACVPADCTTDDDCPGTERCATVSTCAGFGIAGYHCTSPDDECADNDDCGGGVCRFDDDAGIRTCAPPCTVP